MNLSQARVIDPILTQHAIGYRDNSFVGLSVLPRVNVGQRGGQVLKFGKEAFALVNTRRAPGSDTARRSVGFGADRFALEQYSLEALVAREVAQEAAAVPGVDLVQRSINANLSTIQRGQEKEIADIVRSVGSYAQNHSASLTGTDKWSSPDSNPIEAVADAASAVRGKIGVRPNTLVLGDAVADKLMRHAGLIELVKYSQVGMLTKDMLARLLNVQNIIVGEATYADDEGNFIDIWGNDAALVYVPNAADYETPSFGYTYTLAGMPVVEQGYFDPRAKSDVYPITHEAQSVVTCPEAGFLFKAAV